MGTLCTAPFNVVPKVTVSHFHPNTKHSHDLAALDSFHHSGGKKSCSSKSPEIIQYQYCRSQLSPTWGDNKPVIGKLFYKHKRK